MADFVELREDCSHSPLWNADLAPTRIEQRNWSVYHIASLWIGMSVVISTYLLAAGLIQQGMIWWQALVTILAGNVIVLVPMVLNAHAGTKYGIPFPVLCRASSRARGVTMPDGEHPTTPRPFRAAWRTSSAVTTLFPASMQARSVRDTSRSLRNPSGRGSSCAFKVSRSRLTSVNVQP